MTLHRRIAAIVVLGVALGLAGCGRGTGTQAAPEPVAVTAGGTSRAAASAEWQREGERLIADKHRQAENGPYGTDIANWGDWADQSEPVDIRGAGTYEMRVPVSADFDPPNSPSAFAINTPPDFTGAWQVTKNEVRDVDGQRFLVLTLQIDGENVTYPGLTFWVY